MALIINKNYEVFVILFFAIPVKLDARALDFLPEDLIGSTYAKVAKWGFNHQRDENRTIKSEELQEGRSISGQSLFSQRSDVNLRSRQNFGPVYTPNVKKQDGFQDRFNPPPIFAILDKNQPQASNMDTKTVISPPNSYDSGISSYDPNPSGIPDIIKSDKPTKTQNSAHSDPPSLYDSNISSYNPAPSGIPDNNNFKVQGPTFPPYDIVQQESDQKVPSKDTHHSQGSMGDHHHHPYYEDSFKKDQFPSYLYIQNSSSNGYHNQDHEDHPGDDHNFNDHNLDHVNFDHHNFDHHIADQHNSDHHSSDHHSFDHHSSVYDYEEKNPDTVDDLPEYLDHDPHQGKFAYQIPSSYQYDDHPIARPVHKPVTAMLVTTTTTTEAPEPQDERVNKGHYSYYYLGRKLWYIPLYFSVYFIIYITVLILKSIARHKVTFTHDVMNLGKERSFSDRQDYVESVYESTTEAINRFKRRYYAM